MDKIEFKFGDSDEAKTEFTRLHADLNPQWKPIEPEENQSIWRYRSFEQLCELLTSSSLWFSHVSEFNDPYEGLSSKSSERDSILLELFSNSGKNFTGGGFTKGRIHAISHANCWHINNRDSAALWNQYGGERTAIAIKSSPKSLKQAVDTTGHHMMYGKVEYIDIQEEDIPNDPENPAFFKRDDFLYENEYRAVLLDYSRLATLMGNWPEITEMYEKFDGDPSGLSIVDMMKSGYSLDVCLEELIETIYVEPNASERTVDMIRSVVSKFLDCDVKHSDLFNDPVES